MHCAVRELHDFHLHCCTLYQPNCCANGRQEKACWVEGQGEGTALGGALCSLEGSTEPKLMWGPRKWRSRHETKERVGVGAAARMESQAGKLICLGDGMSRRGGEKKGWPDGGRVRGRWKWRCWNKLEMTECCFVGGVGAAVTCNPLSSSLPMSFRSSRNSLLWNEHISPKKKKTNLQVELPRHLCDRS